MSVFTLDVSDNIKSAPYSYLIPSDTKKLYFRIVKNDTIIDYLKELINLELMLKYDDNSIEVVSTKKRRVYLNEEMIEYTLDANKLNSNSRILITPTVKLKGGSYLLSSTWISTYDTGGCDESRYQMVNSLVDAYNSILGLYFKSVKWSEVDVPNGVVGLDSNGDIGFTYLPSDISQHMYDKLIDTTKQNNFQDDLELHGLKIDSKWRLLYYDADDEAWRIANGVYGGSLFLPHKPPAWDVNGGSILDPAINAGTFTQNIVNTVDGGTFTDGSNTFLDANFIQGGTFTGYDIFGGSII